MNKKINNFLFVFITVFLASCIAPTTQRTKPNEEAVAIEAEKQREIAVKEASKSHYRLLRVGGPILKKSLPFCKDRKRKSIGIIYANKFNYDEEFVTLAGCEYNIVLKPWVNMLLKTTVKQVIFEQAKPLAKTSVFGQANIHYKKHVCFI